MDYILVGDDCSECCYVSNAFSLLKLSHKKLLIKDIHSDLISNTLDIISHAIATFVCKNIDKHHKDQIINIVNSAKKNVISWGNTDASSPDKAIHFLNMPFSKYELKNTLAKIEYCDHLHEELNHPIFNKLIGQSQVIRELKAMIMQVARSDTTVLVLGQSGTGKDIIASCIHQASERRSNPLVPINCGAIPSELMESELFGHEKGAFTGALSRRPGRFEIANNGTLFLDEIGDMPLPMQVKLLRVIQERKVERIGGNNTIDVNVRIIAATHKNLENMINEHQFREDLYYRLNVFPIYVPSLNERKEDIPYLIDYQLDKIYDRLKHRVAFTDDAIQLMCDYTWPGNIRELQNFLERMVILYPDHVIGENKIHLNVKKTSQKSKRNKSTLEL